MKGLLLAAGEGTRLRPLTDDRPKPMLSVGGRPVLEYLVALLRQHGIREIAVNLHHRPDVIVRHFGDGSRFGVSLTYSTEERLLGTAGAAASLEHFLDETFVVLYGDVLTDIDLSAVVASHRAHGGIATLVLYRVEDPSRCGVVELDSGGAIRRFVEKPAPGTTDGNLASAGIYVLEPGILDHIPRERPSDFGSDVFPRLLALGYTLSACEPSGYILDIGSPGRYRQAEADWRAGRFRPPPLLSTPSLAGQAVPC